MIDRFEQLLKQIDCQVSVKKAAYMGLSRVAGRQNLMG